MRSAASPPRPRAWAWLGSLLLLGCWLASCSSPETQEKIDWNLSDSLRNYGKVVITIVDPFDSALVIDTVHAGKLEDPKSLKSYDLDPDLGGNYRIVIRGYDDGGLLAFESRIAVVDGAPEAPVKTPQDQLPAFRPKPLGTGFLTLLDISGGALAPEFKPDVFAYAVEVPYEVLQMAVHAVTDSASAISLRGKALLSGDISDPINLDVGRTEIVVAVKGPDGGVRNYLVAVTRKAGNTARLSLISLSAGSLSPVFHPDTLEYAVTVPAEVETVSVSAVSADPLATLTSDGAALDSALGKVVVLDTGATATVQITVRSVDSSATVTYRLDLKRALSADAALSSLFLTGTDLSPEFHPDTLEYAANTAQAQVAVLPVARHKGARIKVGTAAVASGSLSPVIPTPTPGNSLNIAVEVTAADGATRRTYALKVARIALGGRLVAIALNHRGGAVALDSAFRVDRLAYKASVARNIDTLVIGASLNSGLIGSNPPTFTLNGVVIPITTSFTTGTLQNFTTMGALRPGQNILRIEADGVTYSFQVTRQLSKVADLAQLQVSAGTLKPAFSAAVVAYADTVPNSAATFKVTCAPADSQAKVIVRLKRWVPILLKAGGGDTLIPILILPYTVLATDTLLPGVPSDDLDLAVGHNLVEITVLAEDTTQKKIYSVSVERRPSANARLASLVVNPSTTKVPLDLSPAFSPATLSYSGATTAGFLTVTPKAGETGQAILVNGRAVATGAASQSITLVNGVNAIKVEVTAPDKVSKLTYTLSITKNLIIVPK